MPKNQGMKPNETWTHAYLKAYVRATGLNHPEVKLSMSKKDMIAGLKKAKHWGDRAPSFPASVRNTAAGGPKSMRGVPKAKGPAGTAPGGPKSVRAAKARRAEVGRAVLGQNVRATADFNRARTALNRRGIERRGGVSQVEADQARVALRGMLGRGIM